MHHSKFKQQKITWEKKKKLVKQRIKALEICITNNLEQSADMDTPIKCYATKKPEIDNVDSVGVSTSAMERAEEVRANLPPQFPSFVKRMLKSHVSVGFWLGLPNKFCVAHLPKRDDTVVLEDENGEEYDTKYLVGKVGLSGGWRGFSMAHDLRPQDVLVFQLIEHCKFKVYIVRANKFTEIDSAASLLNLNFLSQPIEPDQSGDESENCGSQVIRFPDSPLSFKDMKGLQDFKVRVNGTVIDSEIPTDLRAKYYELCCSQNKFLHENLMPGLNTKLAAGIISEAINIADAIKLVKPSADHRDLESWGKTLKAFEDLGMVVGFLRARIHKLLSLARESRAVIERKRSEKRSERDEAQEEMRGLKMKLSDAKNRVASLDAEIDALNAENEELDAAFMEVSEAPW